MNQKNALMRGDRLQGALGGRNTGARIDLRSHFLGRCSTRGYRL